MRVMVIVKATNESEDGKMPTPELLEQMGAFNQQLKDASILVDADGLRPSAKGARVAFSGQNRSVTKGPFPTFMNSSPAIGSGRCTISTRRSSGSNAVPIPCPDRRSSKSARFMRWKILIDQSRDESPRRGRLCATA
jgi:hypothetical protein